MSEEIYKQRIIDYFKKNLTKGYNSESLKWALINQGYSRIIVENAFEEANKQLAKKVPILKDKPIIKHELIDEFDRPIEIKKSWWKRIFEE